MQQLLGFRTRYGSYFAKGFTILSSWMKYQSFSSQTDLKEQHGTQVCGDRAFPAIQ